MIINAVCKPGNEVSWLKQTRSAPVFAVGNALTSSAICDVSNAAISPFVEHQQQNVTTSNN